MTLPYERTRAVLNVREFLIRLSSPYNPNGIKGIKKEVREEARRLMRHFPGRWEMMRAGEVLPDVFSAEATDDI